MVAESNSRTMPDAEVMVVDLGDRCNQETEYIETEIPTKGMMLHLQASMVKVDLVGV